MRLLGLALATVAAVALSAQDKSYWIANRNSNDIMEITPWGSVLRRVGMGNGLRDAAVAPNTGMIWVLRLNQSTFDVLNPNTGMIVSVTNALGAPFDIAFDAQGTVWVCGGSGVVNYDSFGGVIQQYPLTAGAPLGITIDNLGNKWIAHRTVPGSVSRIDPAGNVVNFPVSGDNPVRPIAVFTGLGSILSRIWVTCDNGGALLELDETGAELNNYSMPSTSIGGVGPVFDNNGNIWVGSFGSGDLFQVDPNSGIVLNTYAIVAPGSAFQRINALSVDTLGRILCTQRITFSGVGPPCQIQRVDPATGMIELPTLLEVPGFAAAGTDTGVSTPYQYSLVVDATGDSDGDGDINLVEIQNGTSPIDPTSNSIFSVDTTGTTSTGSTVSINVRQAAAPTLWAFAYAGSLLPLFPGPIPVPGLNGLLLVDPTTLIKLEAGVGTTSLPLSLPPTPSLAGSGVFIQGAYWDGGTFELRNLSGIRVW